MATKTGSKTATRKPAARKSDAAQKQRAAAKPKVSTKKLKVEAGSAAAEKAHAPQPATPKVTLEAASAPRHEVERVSLIDKKKPRKKKAQKQRMPQDPVKQGRP